MTRKQTQEQDQQDQQPSWNELDQEEQNNRNRAAILALCDTLGHNVDTTIVRALLA